MDALIKRVKRRSRFYRLALIFAWSLFCTALIFIEYRAYRDGAIEHARNDAEAAVAKDLLFRKWAALNGGVYVPVSKYVQPNPYLRVPNREILTADGQILTLVNPAYMTRLVHELGEELNGVKGRLTSLTPTQPLNAPDAWEREALRQLREGAGETACLERIDGIEFYRLMLPFVTEKSCLKCHANQGHKEGEINGAISVSVPMRQFYDLRKIDNAFLMIVFVLLGVTGAVGINFSAKRITAGFLARLETEKLLHQMNKQLEKNLSRKTSFLEKAQQKLRDKTKSCETLVGELKSLQTRLIENEKLSALGLLVSGIAHEINTPLGTIVSAATSLDILLDRFEDFPWQDFYGFSETETVLLRSFLGKCRSSLKKHEFLLDPERNKKGLLDFFSLHGLALPEDKADDLSDFISAAEAEDYLPFFEHKNFEAFYPVLITFLQMCKSNFLIDLASGKIKKEIGALKLYSRHNVEETLETSSLNELMDEALLLFQGKMTKDVTILKNYREEVRLPCYPEKVNHIFVNLISNALQAMKCKGSLEISIERRSDTALAAIANTGPRIPDKVREKIFKPFFTTKNRGEGTGLGLSISKELTEKHGGEISFTSTKAKTTFYVTFPLEPSSGSEAEHDGRD